MRSKQSGFDFVDVNFVLGEHEIDLKKMYANEGDRLFSKTGILKVYHTDGSTTALARQASQNIADKYRDEIDCIVCITQSSDAFLPAMACLLQDDLGLRSDCLAFDINQGCSGFAQGLLVCLGLLGMGRQSVLLVTADRYRAKLAADDRATNAIFSDGASATLVRAGSQLNLIDSAHFTDGSGAEHLYHGELPGRPRPGGERHLHMSGSSVFHFTFKEIPSAISSLCAKNDVEISDVSKVLLHQASELVVDSIQKRLSLHDDQVPRNYMHYGNTVSSTIPALLFDRRQQTSNNSGDQGHYVIAGFGVGLSASLLLLRGQL
jgi:3-oxoacyl-[acyl-carrier-protein] synthase-3